MRKCIIIFMLHLFTNANCQSLLQDGHSIKYDSSHSITDITIYFKLSIHKDTVINFNLKEHEYNYFMKTGLINASVLRQDISYLIKTNGSDINSAHVEWPDKYVGKFKKLKLKLNKGDSLIFTKYIYMDHLRKTYLEMNASQPNIFFKEMIVTYYDIKNLGAPKNYIIPLK